VSACIDKKRDMLLYRHLPGQGFQKAGNNRPCNLEPSHSIDHGRNEHQTKFADGDTISKAFNFGLLSARSAVASPTLKSPTRPKTF